MNLIEYKKEFYINSRARLSGTHSDFTIQLDISDSDQFDSVVVRSCIIPKSYYLLAAPHNTLLLHEGLASVIITMPEGNYDRRSFANVLKATLTTNSPNGLVYDITYPSKASSPDTGKYTYTSSGVIQPTFTFPSTSHMFEPMGFDPESANTFVGSELTSANVIKLQREDTLLINSNICSNDNSTSILQEVFSAANDPNYCNIIYEVADIELCTKKMTSTSSGVYRFTITDEDFNVINLNGLNVTIVLVCYRANRLASMLREFIKLITTKLIV